MSTPTETDVITPYEEHLAALVERVQEYMHLPDPGPFVLVLAAVAANRLKGNPVWLMLVAPASSGKTELLDTLLGVPKVHPVATLTEAALLSGTPSRDRASNASGGLLRTIGEEGVVVAKDFTSVLCMNRNQRAAILAALREIYDGCWVRHVGADGGRKLSWDGRLGFLGGVTDIIDSHHGVISALGDRFLYCRIHAEPSMRRRVARKVIERAEAMRAKVSDTLKSELRELVAGFFECFDQSVDYRPLTDEEKDWLARAADLAARGRSAVERDSYRRDIINVLTPESPGRLAGGLGQLFYGLRTIGCIPDEAKRLVRKVAIDCLPRERARLLLLLSSKPTLSIEEMRKDEEVDYPPTAIRRALEDMECLRMVERVEKSETADHWKLYSSFRESWSLL